MPADTATGALVIGVDVGTGSARAAVFSTAKLRHEAKRKATRVALPSIGYHPLGTPHTKYLNFYIVQGQLLAVASSLIKIYKPEGSPLLYQQSSTDIWRAVTSAVRDAVVGAVKASPCSTPDSIKEAIRAIAFDATCSLVVLGEDDQPITVSPDGQDDEKNIVLWLDHRAVKQANSINGTNHHVLKYVGGKVSPEMEMPKLKWLKEELPSTWSRLRQAFDLGDWLSYRATGKAVRSLCSVTCKWNYAMDGAGGSSGWDRSFLETIGLEDLTEDMIGSVILPPGEVVGPLTDMAAQELGLRPGTLVAVGAIDAHVGGVGCLGAVDEEGEGMESRLALVCGTSSCHMASSAEKLFVPGIWGPFYSAMVPGLWLNEAGQSATGALLEHVLTSHPAYTMLKELAFEAGKHPTGMLQAIVASMAAKEKLPERQSALLTKHLHVLPHHAGCRSPLADPELRGVVVGVGLDTSIENLALTYLSTIQGLAYGTKHIVDALEAAGHTRITAIYVSGGLSKNALFVREHADVLGRRLVLPREKEGVLLGAAILAATACGAYASVREAMEAMSGVGEAVRPTTDARLIEFHRLKEKVFHNMTEDQYRYRREMEAFDA